MRNKNNFNIKKILSDENFKKLEDNFYIKDNFYKKVYFSKKQLYFIVESFYMESYGLNKIIRSKLFNRIKAILIDFDLKNSIITKKLKNLSTSVSKFDQKTKKYKRFKKNIKKAIDYNLRKNFFKYEILEDLLFNCLKSIKNKNYSFYKYMKWSNNKREIFNQSFKDKIVSNYIFKIVSKNSLFNHRQSRNKIIYNLYSTLNNILIQKQMKLPIMKIDIKGYFNSIDWRAIDWQEIEKDLDKDIAWKKILKRKYDIKDTKILLHFIKGAFQKSNQKIGLPQGINFSSLFAEWYAIKKIDKLIKMKTYNMLGYFRYVDDILIIFNNLNNSELLMNKIRNLFKTLNLSLNTKKSTVFIYEPISEKKNKKNKQKNSETKFTFENLDKKSHDKTLKYLGYEFIFEDNNLKIKIDSSKFTKKLKYWKSYLNYYLNDIKSYEKCKVLIQKAFYKRVFYKDKIKYTTGFLNNYKFINNLNQIKHLQSFFVREILKIIINKNIKITKQTVIDDFDFISNFFS
ncbi:hypothetical protein SHELI_v1c10000 [Spiroplasma helicoides]|uniref:Reverse transcriptase domain-containing protein n=2 Tax=Spiroplasma helicoides TaxID=216938 RepID=A0A1B3SM08_9MOLU|nr:hypothetical protein SHELI_v1c10000 [Spiroplasma helicoides]